MSQFLPMQYLSPAPIQDVEQLVGSYPGVPLSVDCVIFGFEENKLKILVIRSDLDYYAGKWSLLGDVVGGNETLDDAAYRVLKQRTGMTDIYLKQVQAFSEINRHPGGRVVTVAYVSLLNIRHHELSITENELHWQDADTLQQMAFDHTEIVDTCFRWLQKGIQENPLGFNLLPKRFSLRELQNLYEAILNIELDRRNFRKKFFSMDFLIDTGELEADVKHRPGKLYEFDFSKYERKKRKFMGIDF